MAYRRVLPRPAAAAVTVQDLRAEEPSDADVTIEPATPGTIVTGPAVEPFVTEDAVAPEVTPAKAKTPKKAKAKK